MRAVLILLAVVAAIAAEPVPRIPIVEERIIGGSVTTISQYPQASSLLFSSNLVSFGQSCGGSIINNRSVLSAAHCFFQRSAQQWRMRIGSTNANSGGVVHNTGQIIMHPQYNNNNLNNDIAILRSASTFSLNNNGVPRAGSIAGANYNLGDNQVVWAIGWGRTAVNGPSSEQLRHVQIWTVNQATCRNRYAELGWAITDNMLCSGWLDVGGRDQCQGDSGGPLFHNGIIVGVCSFGHQCALARFPGVNARVSRFTAWIQNNA